MLCLLHHIPTEETIRYALGCAVPKPVDPQWQSKAQAAQQQVLQSSQPRFCWRVFPSAPLLEQLLSGQDIRSHLSGCTDCILLAATLGAQVDALIRRAQVRDMEQALWLDAAASAAIEEVCDTAQRQIAEQLGQSLTHRFSCGYGDLPLSIQPQLYAAGQCKKHRSFGQPFLHADTGQIGDCHPGHPARRYCRFGAKALHHLSFKRKLCFKKKGCFLWKID